jgi:hypothetical protein
VTIRLAALILCASLSLTQGAAAALLQVGPGRAYALPSAAAAAAHDGDHVLIDPGRYSDCAVWRATNLLIEGAGPADAVVIDGPVCQGKALFVTAGQEITLRNLTLADATAPEGNGAGIRAEGQSLVADHLRLIHDQDGILTGADPQRRIIVRHSLFLNDGACLQACAHGVYAGRIALLRIESSQFSDTREGHHIKSRALRTEIIGNTIADGPDGTASYLIDIPNGGALLIRGNSLEKGPHTQNPNAIIAIGEEGVTNPSTDLVIEANNVRNDTGRTTRLVLNPAALAILLSANTLFGPITP